MKDIYLTAFALVIAGFIALSKFWDNRHWLATFIKMCGGICLISGLAFLIFGLLEIL